MLTDRPLTGRAAARRVLLCLLLLGVLLHAQAGVLRQLLGAAHWHQDSTPVRSATSPAPWGGWAHLQAWRQQLHARSPLVGGHALPGDRAHRDGDDHDRHGNHHHDASQRHHHAGDDTTVVALEFGGDAADPLTDSLAGSVLQPLGLAGLVHWAGTPDAHTVWPVAASAAWRNAGARVLDRPPRG